MPIIKYLNVKLFLSVAYINPTHLLLLSVIPKTMQQLLKLEAWHRFGFVVIIGDSKMPVFLNLTGLNPF